MTEVISITSDNGSHFGSPLRRTSSSTSFFLQNPPSYSRPAPNLKSRYAAVGYDTSKIPASQFSSAPSSPRLNASGFSNQPSYTSTPSSSFSLDEECGLFQGDDVVFHPYQSAGFLDEMQGPEPAPSPDPLETPAPSPSHENGSGSRLIADAPNQTQVAGDDSSINEAPTRHVDYLSHTWKEEDIWASWRHIVARRKEYNNSPRLENASWRTWAKAKHQLKTISPETLNW